MFDLTQSILEKFFLLGPLPDRIETGTYIPLLVALSYIIASLGAFTGLRLAVHMHYASSERQRSLLHTGGAFAFGAGIWSMHFIGMLAYRMDMALSYDPLLTVLSMMIAIVIAYGVLSVIQVGHLTPGRLAGGSVLLGLAISAMHYTGMAAMKMDADLRYVPSLFFLSILIAVIASGAALWIVFTLAQNNGRWRAALKMLAAFVMGAAICGMHYTGVAAAVFIPYADCRYDPNQNFMELGLAVGATSSLIFAMALTLSFYTGGRLSSQRARSFYGGNLVFLQLAGLLSTFLILSTASYVFLNDTLWEQKQSGYVLKAASQQRALTARYVLNTVMLMSRKVVPYDTQFDGEEESASTRIEALIDQNYEGLLRQGNVNMGADPETGEERILFIGAVRDKLIAEKIRDSQKEWNTLRDMVKKLAREDAGPQESEVVYRAFNRQLLMVVKAQDSVLQAIQINLDKENENLAFRQQMLLLMGTLAFFLTLVYAKFKIADKIDHARKEVEEYQDTLEQRVEEQTETLRQAQRDEQRRRLFFDTLLNNMPLGIFAKDAKDDFRMVMVNKHAETLFGLKAKDIIGTTDHDNWPRQEADFFRATDLKVMEEGKLVEIEAEPLTTPGGTVMVHTLKVPIYDEDAQPSILLGIFEDVTGRIREKQELKAAKEKAEKLNIRMQEYTDKLELAREDAELASRAKSDFLANMSHEIRTPMNAVLGMSGLLMDTPLNEEQKEWVRAINGSGETLLNIINDIIDISKIEAGKLVLEKIDFDLLDTIQEVAGLYAFQAREKGLEMIMDTDPEMPRGYVGDPVRIKQIFSNLISNALKFTFKGHILIKVSQGQTTDGVKTNLRFRIEDTGIGIPKDKQKKIFEKFSQAEESTTRKFGGTGLGLTIVAELVDMMGGEIEVESEPGSGSAFLFNLRLPVSKKVQIQQIDEDVKALRVLIVDDYTLTSGMLKETLERRGLVCDLSASAEEAEEKLKSGERYDVCLVDYALGGMDGLTLVKRIRADKAYDHLILMMISGAMESRPYSELKSLGLQGYLKKPFRPDQIMNALKIAMHNKRAGADMPLITRHNATTILKGVTADSESPQERPQYPDKRVLAVEDMKMNMMLIKKVLGKFGVQIDTAANGVEALEKAKKSEYDLIFMDCQMPEMDGFEATQKIRTFEKTSKRRNVPIVALTADAMIGDREKCLAAGMNDYINKPFKESDIASAFINWFEDKAA